MVLTFKSSISEERVLIERGRDGSQRVCKAVQADYNPKMWNLSLEHPSGQTWHGTFHGDGATVNVALAQMLVDRANEYSDEINRGHRKPAAPRDVNVAIDDLGNAIGRPVIKNYLPR